MNHLTIITRHFAKRPELYRAHIRSLAAQTCDDFHQIVLWDNVGRGIDAAQMALRDVRVNGQWVWVLDDDDLAEPDAVETIVRHTQDGSDAVIFQFNHQGRTLPLDRNSIKEGHIGVSALVVSRLTWHQTKEHFGARYAGDFDWIQWVVNNYVTAFVPHVIGHISKQNMGKADDE